MHNLFFFCTFFTFAQKFFKGWGCNFAWSFSRVMRALSMNIVFVARIIRHKLCIIYAFFDFFVQKSFLTKNCFLTAERNLTTRGPLYTCLVQFRVWHFSGCDKDAGVQDNRRLNVTCGVSKVSSFEWHTFRMAYNLLGHE